MELGIEMLIFWHGEEVIFAGWDGVGLSGAFRTDCAADFYVERGQHFGALWVHPDVVGDLKETGADSYRGGI